MERSSTDEVALRRLASAMPGLVWASTPDGRTEWVNEQLSAYAGTSDGWPRVHPDDRMALRLSWERALATGEAWSEELRLRRHDGGHRWFLARCVPWREDGRLTRWLGTATDIDDRRRAEADLSDREEKLRQLTENAREVFYMSDVTLDRILYVSPAYERIWGRSCESLFDSPRSFADAIHEEDRARVLEGTLRRQRRGEPHDHVYRIIRPDGSLRWIRDRGSPVVGVAGEVVCYVGTAADITDLKQVEQELRLLQSLSVDVIEAESTTRAFEVVLGELCRTFGWTVGQAWVPRADGELLELAAGAAGRADDLRTLDPGSRRPRFARGEGLPGLVWASGRSAWIADVADHPTCPRAAAAVAAGLRTGMAVPVVADGEVVAVLEFFSTERRDEEPRLNQLLTSICAQLASSIRRKLAEEALRRTEAQLRQAQKMEAVGRLAGGVAHDFNNLLTAILGYAELLSERIDPRDPLRRPIEQIRKAGERAASLTRQLLVFSRNEAVAPQVLCPNAVIGDLEQLLRRLLGEDVGLSVQLGAGVGRVTVDKGYLEQVVMNLCVNARDAMPRGGRLTIETSDVVLDPSARMARGFVEQRGDYVRIAVTDSGCGMPPDVLAHLFEPFFTTKEVGKGTGLGLSTVYGIVQGAGGHIAVQSEVGEGTSFTVYLPRTITEASPPSPATGVFRPRGDETVLLVEDDEMVRGLARGALESRGYRVIDVANGGEALLTCERHQGAIHLLVSDVVMPDLSGPDLVRRLDVVCPGLKVLFCSGYTSGAIQHAEALGSGRAFLQKPFTPGALARKVREVLDAA